MRLSKQNGKKFGISHDSHIVQYNNGGFYSYTFHVTNAHSEIKPFDTGDGWYYVRFLDSYYDSFDDFRKEYRRAKFAYLDASGKVIATTNEIDIWQDSESVNMQITVSGEKATCEISTNKAGMLWGIVFIVAGIIIFVLLPLNIIFWSVVALIFLFKFIKKKTSLRK